MTTQREVLHKALEALEIAKEHLVEYDEMTHATAAIKAALEQEEQTEPVAFAKRTAKKLRITTMNMTGEEGWRPLVYADTIPQSSKDKP